MSIRKKILFFFLCSLCFPFVGCQSLNSDTPPTIHLSLSLDPSYIDPRKVNDITSSALITMMGEGLMRINSKNEPEPALAESFELYEKGTKYFFEIRKNAKWSNGDPVTPADIEYSWKSILDPDFPSGHAEELYVIKNARLAKEGILPLSQVGIKALDSHTLVVELERPTPYFLQLLASPMYFPVNKQVDQNHPNWAENTDENLVTCGPFKLIKWEHDTELVLEKNENYWDAKKVEISQIHISIIQDEKIPFNLFQKGKLDFLGHPFGEFPIDLGPLLKSQGKLHQKSVADFFWYNVNTTHPLLSNRYIRQALSKAIDRESIAHHMAHVGLIPNSVMQLHPAVGLLPSVIKVNKASLISSKSEPQVARALFMQGLKEEGLTPDQVPTFQITFKNGEVNKRIAQTIQQEWLNNLGLKTSLKSLERKEYIDNLHKKDYEITQLAGRPYINDPIDVLEIFKFADSSLGNNFTGWEDLEYIELLNESMAELHPEKREHLLAKAEQIFMRDLPAIPLFERTYEWVLNPNLKGVLITNLGLVDFRYAKFKTRSLRR
jgi:oligopeptide transport system substrate-binding protein